MPAKARLEHPRRAYIDSEAFEDRLACGMIGRQWSYNSRKLPVAGRGKLPHGTMPLSSVQV